MKCTLEDNPYSDKNFQIEFDNIKEIEELKDSLTHMLKYMKICKDEGDDLPPLVYKIKQINNLNK